MAWPALLRMPLFCSLILGVGGGVVYIFAAEAPYIAIDQLHMAPNLFGLLNLIPFFGLFLGGFFSSYVSSRLFPKTLILMGSLIYCFASLFMLLSFKMGVVNPSTLFLFPLIIFFSFPMIFASSSLLGMSISSQKSYASSLINFLQIMIAVGIMEMVFLFPIEHAAVLPFVYSIVGGVLLVLCAILYALPIKNPS